MPRCAPAGLRHSRQRALVVLDCVKSGAREAERGSNLRALLGFGCWGKHVIVRHRVPEGMPRPTGDEGQALLDAIWLHFSAARVADFR